MPQWSHQAYQAAAKLSDVGIEIDPRVGDVAGRERLLVALAYGHGLRFGSHWTSPLLGKMVGVVGVIEG